MDWKMKAMTAITVFGILLAGCGSGGGGGPGASGAKTAGVGAAGLSEAISGVTFGLDAMSVGERTSVPKLSKMARSRDLNASVARFYKNLKANRFMAKTLARPDAIPCSLGGTLELIPTTDGFTLTYTNCKEPGDTDGTYTDTDGVITFSETATDFSFSMSGRTAGTSYSERTTRRSDGRLLEEWVASVTMSGTFGSETVSCGEDDLPKSVTMTINGTFSDKWDEDGNGVLDGNGSGKATDFTIALQVDKYDPITCEPMDFSVSLSGGVSSTDNIESNNSFTMTISNSDSLKMDVKSTTVGVNVTVSGGFSCSASCFNGSLTFATTTPLFIPTDAECPTSGVIEVSGDLTGTITYTSTGGVEIDNGSDGSVDEVYENCDEAEACV